MITGHQLLASIITIPTPLRATTAVTRPSPKPSILPGTSPEPSRPNRPLESQPQVKRTSDVQAAVQKSPQATPFSGSDTSDISTSANGAPHPGRPNWCCAFCPAVQQRPWRSRKALWFHPVATSAAAESQGTEVK